MNEEINCYMIYLLNWGWSNPEKPYFVINGTREEVEKLCDNIIHDWEWGRNACPDTKLKFRIIPNYENVQAFWDKKYEIEKRMMERDFSYKALKSLIPPK